MSQLDWRQHRAFQGGIFTLAHHFIDQTRYFLNSVASGSPQFSSLVLTVLSELVSLLLRETLMHVRENHLQVFVSLSSMLTSFPKLVRFYGSVDFAPAIF